MHVSGRLVTRPSLIALAGLLLIPFLAVCDSSSSPPPSPRGQPSARNPSPTDLIMDRAEVAIDRAQDASVAASLAVQHGTLVVQALAIFVAAAVVFVTIYSVLRTKGVVEEARNALADARRYLEDLSRLTAQAETARTDAESSARKSREASEDVRASVSAAQRTLEQLETAVSSGRTGAFLNWIELSRFQKTVGDRAAAVASLDHALADAEQSKSTNPNEYTMLAGSYDDSLASDKALHCTV